MNRFKWWLAGILTVVAVTASAKMVVNGYLEKAGFERLAADPVTNVFQGRMYFNTVSNLVKFYDGTSWGNVGGGATPTGTMAMFAGSSIPAGWVFGDGTSYDSVGDPSFAALFAEIGIDYGGAGAAAFNVPDCRGRMLAGRENTLVSRLTAAVSGVNGGTLGAAGGDQRSDAHNHATSIDHLHAGWTTSSYSHDHRLTSGGTQHTNNTNYVNAGGNAGYVFSSASRATYQAAGTTTVGGGLSVNEVNYDVADRTSTTANSGTSQNVPPVIVFNCIIKK